MRVDRLGCRGYGRGRGRYRGTGFVLLRGRVGGACAIAIMIGRDSGAGYRQDGAK